MWSSLEILHDLIKSTKIFLIINIITVWSIHDDSNVTRISTKTWRKWDVIPFDKSDFDWKMNLEFLLFDEFMKSGQCDCNILFWNGPFVYPLSHMTIHRED